jgi:Trp operon repressor
MEPTPSQSQSLGGMVQQQHPSELGELLALIEHEGDATKLQAVKSLLTGLAPQRELKAPGK